jgi:hypothetical protein
LHIYLDEYQRFATSTTAELLTQGRKYGAGVTLAHQDLHQIRDLRIRNASRHAGTLIVLGVTRPDAEELAGEFPITPREEWVETIQEVDGTEPKLVPHPNVATEIYSTGHSDPNIDLAARSFLVGKAPARPGGVAVSPRVQVDIRERTPPVHSRATRSAVHELLGAAMEGKLSAPAAFADTLLQTPHTVIWQVLDEYLSDTTVKVEYSTTRRSICVMNSSCPPTCSGTSVNPSPATLVEIDSSSP